MAHGQGPPPESLPNIISTLRALSKEVASALFEETEPIVADIT